MKFIGYLIIADALIPFEFMENIRGRRVALRSYYNANLVAKDNPSYATILIHIYARDIR